MAASSRGAGTGIKRGVSLYSFQEEYFLRKMTLEDCIATCARFGANGIESIAEQMMPGFPNLSDAFYDQWHGWMAKYGAPKAGLGDKTGENAGDDGDRKLEL